MHAEHAEAEGQKNEVEHRHFSKGFGRELSERR